jgi:Xaa-Pro aminopeptidase
MNEKLPKIRAILHEQGLQGCIIPTGDPHCSEYVPDYYKTREWASEFTGSNGILVVTEKSAALWTDSRYYLQAEQELHNSEIILMKDGLDGIPKIEEWLNLKLDSNSTISINAEMISYKKFAKLRVDLKKHNIELVDGDIISKVWTKRPALPTGTIFQIQAVEKTSKLKLNILANDIFGNSDIDAHIVTSLTQICWLLNLRGSDIQYTPVFLSYMYITREKIVLFIDSNKLTDNIISTLTNENIEIEPYDNFYDYIRTVKTEKNLKVLVDKNTLNARLHQILVNQDITIKTVDISPIDQLKSHKSQTEIAGIKKALHKDSISLCNMFYNIRERICNEQVTEQDISNELCKLKSKHDGFIEESFETIAAYKENAAIVHYTPKQNSKILQPKGLLLVDTGTQYTHGTTDSTRTIALGPLTEEEKKAYTIVLKSHITLACTTFPKGTSGIQLDTFAKMHYWKNHMDFGHGTGHGVGYCLSVHEGPNSISPRSSYKFEKAGLVTTIEPGFYKENKFGIRLENMTVTVEDTDNDYLRFETIHFFPFERDAINKDMMTDNELKWLNNYHAEIYSRLSPFLKEPVANWLKEATKTM